MCHISKDFNPFSSLLNKNRELVGILMRRQWLQSISNIFGVISVLSDQSRLLIMWIRMWMRLEIYDTSLTRNHLYKTSAEIIDRNICSCHTNHFVCKPINIVFTCKSVKVFIGWDTISSAPHIWWFTNRFWSTISTR